MFSQALTSFRDHAASLLLATPAASRGLDLPEIAYIYNLDAPASAVDYVHRAGRAGRIGSFSPGNPLDTLKSHGHCMAVALNQCLINAAFVTKGMALAVQAQQSKPCT